MSEIFYAGMIPFYLDSCFIWTEGFDAVALFGWSENTNLRTIIVSEPAVAPQAINNIGSAGVTDCAALSSPSVGMGEAVRLEATPPDLSNEFGQFIEITVENLFQLGGNPDNFRSEIQIFNFGANPNTANPGGNFGYMRWESDVQNLRLIVWSQDSDGFFVGDSPQVDLSAYGSDADIVVLRLDSYRTGRSVLSINGVSVIDYVDTSIVDAGPGFHQGITMWWDVQFGACGDASSPRIVYATGGEICGPEPPPTCIPDVMGSGLWELLDPPGSWGTELLQWNPGETPPYYNTDRALSLLAFSQQWPETFSGYQSIEATVTNFGNYDGGYWSDSIQVHCRVEGDARLVGFIYKSDGLGGGGTYEWGVYCNDAADNLIYPDVGGTLAWPFAANETFTVRMESDVDGAFRFYLGESLLLGDTVPGLAVGPTKVGLLLTVNYIDTDNTASPQITDICIIAD